MLTLADVIGANGGLQGPSDELPQEAPLLWNQDQEECDRYTFEDSDRFEEDSLCSWSSEPESLCNNWRGWKRPIATSFGHGVLRKQVDEGKFNF